MQPINKLLSRIRWDAEFGCADFEVGYLDRLAGGIVRVSLADLVIETGNKDNFMLMDSEGVWQRIPFHRVREVYRNNRLIWQRDGATEES